MGKKWSANSGLLTALRGINGSTGGYHTNLENRVYLRELMPEEDHGVERPYISVTELPANYEHAPRHVNSTLSWLLLGVVDDTDAVDDSDLTAEAISNLHDDIIKALMSDLTLGGAVRDLSIVLSDTTPAFAGYQTIEFQVSALQVFDAADLGT